MLKDYFDNVYLINLKSRPDRLKTASEECNRIGLPFQRIEAVNGYELGISAKPFPGSDPVYWNPGAAGLVVTTYRIIDDAIKKRYRRILIMEDDIEFRKDLDVNKLVDENFHLVPTDWHMLQFGSQHCREPEMITRHISRIKFAFCLHCYAVNSSIFGYYRYLLKTVEKQLDLYTVEDIQPLGKCYSFEPNIAFQKPSYSNISQRNVNYSFLKENQKFF